LTDKLLICVRLISLAQFGLAPAWMVWIIIGREFAITAFRGFAYARGVVVPASPPGKGENGGEGGAGVAAGEDENGRRSRGRARSDFVECRHEQRNERAVHRRPGVVVGGRGGRARV